MLWQMKQKQLKDKTGALPQNSSLEQILIQQNNSSKQLDDR